MIQAKRIMLDHTTGELTYSLYRDSKQLLHDDCDKIDVQTSRQNRFETDGEYTILSFEHPVDVEVHDMETIEGVKTIAKVGDAK